MELNIQELDNEYEFEHDLSNVDIFREHEEFEEIPENMPIKVIKKNVQFEEPIKPVHQVIPNPKPQISYEDILSKMGMFVSDGKLHLLDDVNNEKIKKQMKEQIKQNKQQHPPIKQPQQNIPPNSYIYNKYFKEELQPQETIRKPMTKDEYTKMLLLNLLQRERIKQMKSTKLMMPTSNISMASGNTQNLNKLFQFPKR